MTLGMVFWLGVLGAAYLAVVWPEVQGWHRLRRTPRDRQDLRRIRKGKQSW